MLATLVLMSKKPKMADGLHWVSGKASKWSITRAWATGEKKKHRNTALGPCSPQEAPLHQKQWAGEHHQDLPQTELPQQEGKRTLAKPPLPLSALSPGHTGEEQSLRYLYFLSYEMLWGQGEEAQHTTFFPPPQLCSFPPSFEEVHDLTASANKFF